MAVAFAWALVACHDPEPLDLALEGPERVRVDRLGPVVGGPRVVLTDGSEPEGVMWSLSRDGVARLDPEGVVATGPGEVSVVAEWEDQRVEWLLVVELRATLAFRDPPATVGVGEVLPLAIEARSGDAVVEVGPVSWSSSDARVLAVEDGRATGVAPGIAFVTASAGGASAMLEIEVVAR